MRTDIFVTPPTILRKNYVVPTFLVDNVNMDFDLDPVETRIVTQITMQHNLASSSKEIILFGEEVELVKLRLNGKQLKPSQYKLEAGKLRILSPFDKVFLEIETLTSPEKNTSLMGLYMSNNNFFTQCEAEGFRKIIYFPDRPDVMATYTVILRADKKKYPVLLSNGNLIEEGNLINGRHYAKWKDPFKKPSYLFALVAGNLVCNEQKIRLKSGREVLLQVWVENINLDKTQHAMNSLIHSIRWDEERFGLELDLDRFMIVAVSDFNMGAMENKGLNIFNTKYILANSHIATDVDYANIEAVVGHEYFHNWTGNRVTCRDWFQLSLKEGLTVFREQEFSADMLGTDSGQAVKRIEDVSVLRQVQFPEDAGPMAHSVRPDSYIEINNFYTATIYEKGAEVVRMYQTLFGHEGFRKGMDLYFKRHDSQAVECDDFRFAMADANGRDLSQFERWYTQAGTPQVRVRKKYNSTKKTYELVLSQTCTETPGQTKKLPFHIPVAVGLLDANGKDMALRLSKDKKGKMTCDTTRILELTKTRQTFCFIDVIEPPVLSIFRNFSAPVVLDIEYSDTELMHLLTHDSDLFNRWEAGHRLATRILLGLSAAMQAAPQAGYMLVLQDILHDASSSFNTLCAAFSLILNDITLDATFRAQLLTLPSEATLSEQSKVIDPQAIHKSRQYLLAKLSQTLREDFLGAYYANQTPGAYSPSAEASGKRALKNIALSYLIQVDDPDAQTLAQEQCNNANNMTDRLAGLVALTNSGAAGRVLALEKFYKNFEQEALVIDKWFALQATASASNLPVILTLLEHPAFTFKNPNRVRSLIFSFCNSNLVHFHAVDGSGYAFWADQVIKLNGLNPQVAARLTRSLDRWCKYIPVLQKKMYAALQRVATVPNLSKDVLEVITKILAN